MHIQLLQLSIYDKYSHFLPLLALSRIQAKISFPLLENHCNENNFSNQLNNFIMDIIAIESKTFDQMKERFKDFSRQVKDLCGNNQDKEQWLGNDDVCGLL